MDNATVSESYASKMRERYIYDSGIRGNAGRGGSDAGISR